MASGDLPTPREKESTEGAPVWIVSFADMSLLLLGFFTMLLAVSSQMRATDEDVLRILASVKVGFGYRPTESSPKDELDLAVLYVLATKKRGPLKTIPERTAPAIPGKTIRDKDEWVRVRGVIGEIVVFRNDSADLPDHPDVQFNLDLIATVVRDHYRRIVIQGHCSAGEAARHNGGHWLSYRRAVTIRNELMSRGVDGKRIRVVSCSAHDRAPETSARIHRRVEVTFNTYYLPGSKPDY